MPQRLGTAGVEKALFLMRTGSVGPLGRGAFLSALTGALAVTAATASLPRPQAKRWMARQGTESFSEWVKFLINDFVGILLFPVVGSFTNMFQEISSQE